MNSYNFTIQRFIVAIISLLPRPLDIKFHGFLRRVLERSLEYRCQTKFGLHMVCSTKEYVESRILHFGVWEPDVTEIISHITHRDAVFVDIGANVGYDTLLAAKLVGKNGKVISIEPSPSVLIRLRRNISLNEFDNIRVVESAVGSTLGLINLYRGDVGNQGMTTTIESMGNGLEATVPVSPLHELISAEEAKRVSVIKIDVEGSEPEVIQSIAEHIDFYPNLESIIVEVSDGYERATQFKEFFSGSGFATYMLPEETITAYLGRRRTVPLLTPLTRDGRTKFDILITRRAIPPRMLEII